jgi:hypothetical protein
MQLSAHKLQELKMMSGMQTDPSNGYDDRNDMNDDDMFQESGLAAKSASQICREMNHPATHPALDPQLQEHPKHLNRHDQQPAGASNRRFLTATRTLGAFQVSRSFQKPQ